MRRVKGYRRKDGIKVKPYRRSKAKRKKCMLDNVVRKDVKSNILKTHRIGMDRMRRSSQHVDGETVRRF